MRQRIAILGSGFSSLSAASYLAQAGLDVTVFEKNTWIGGRAQQYHNNGFTFDMGPTWYWMPDVFERFFADFDKHPEQYYELIRLSPSYQVFYGPEDNIKVPDRIDQLYEIFDQLEPGSSHFLRAFLKEAEDNYSLAITDLVYQPGRSPLELVTPKTLLKLNQVFRSISRRIRKHIKDKRLIALLEFPVLFLGAKPKDTPALYSFMNWADFGLGTWHPKGGMYKVVEGMEQLARSLGVRFELDSPVDGIRVVEGRATGIEVRGQFLPFDLVLSGADYHHTEGLLPPEYRQYSERYWDRKTFAPSSLLFYVGLDCKVEGVEHHSLFFDADFDLHAADIYDQPAWPKRPLFYASFSSKTDAELAPAGMESATFLIPLAPGLQDSEEMREQYFEKIMERILDITGQDLRPHVLFKRSFAMADFIDEYNSYKGNAYGLANTLTQTAFLRPGIKSKKVDGLYFCGQLTVPGPGVPPSLISGKIVSELIVKEEIPYEITI